MTNAEKEAIRLVKLGILSIDRQGRIWRHRRTFYNWSGATKTIVFNPPKRAEHSNMGNGYLSLQLKVGNKSCRAMAHRVVWIYFNGEILDGKEINHINGKKSDNRLSNLEPVTRAENMKHARMNGWLNNKPKGEDHYNSKLTVRQVERIRKIGKSKLLYQAELARMFNVSTITISRIIRFLSWK